MPWERKRPVSRTDAGTQSPTGLLEHDQGLGRGVDGQRARPLHRAVGPAGDAVAASGVGEPQPLLGDSAGSAGSRRVELGPQIGPPEPLPASPLGAEGTQSRNGQEMPEHWSHRLAHQHKPWVSRPPHPSRWVTHKFPSLPPSESSTHSGSTQGTGGLSVRSGT